MTLILNQKEGKNGTFSVYRNLVFQIMIARTEKDYFYQNLMITFQYLLIAEIFALLYLLSDSTTVPLADAKLSGPRDAF